jgi:transcriptional regulator GlxA family with amidase domain
MSALAGATTCSTRPSLSFRFRQLSSFQQSANPYRAKTPAGRFAPLLAWAREHLDAPLTVEDMAGQARMSSRHFARAFIAETGTMPSKAVERLRIEVARQRVQFSSEAIEHVAQSTGFRDPERLHPRLWPAAAIAAPRGAGGVRPCKP